MDNTPVDHTTAEMYAEWFRALAEPTRVLRLALLAVCTLATMGRPALGQGEAILPSARGTSRGK